MTDHCMIKICVKAFVIIKANSNVKQALYHLVPYFSAWKLSKSDWCSPDMSIEELDTDFKREFSKKVHRNVLPWKPWSVEISFEIWRVINI